MHDKIHLNMGSGGLASRELLEEVFLPLLGNEVLNLLDDSAEIALGSERIAFTTDSFTVHPIFFPGGNIGTLSVCGTVNDLAAKGATPVALSAAFTIEEGFPIADLRTIVHSMRDSADLAGAQIVTGDTKVVGKGVMDGIFITTSGIGRVLEGLHIFSGGARPSDLIIISGTAADHGVAILNAREKLGFNPEIRSDVAPVHRIVERISHLGPQIHAMRDPTRGGIAGVLHEIARASRVTIKIVEDAVPVRPDVRACCALLGLDPLSIANEGKLIIFTAPESAETVLECVRKLPEGKEAAIIGEVEAEPYSEGSPPVILETSLGTRRFLPLAEGEPLPRIC
ncbi:MAG: hydrogenase expression/formation protein HypE [Candidatus Aureabacteria bacterium]|nr:hydrogenase expression/formation protein HypE [Candidatus Auribacterota bacterium]